MDSLGEGGEEMEEEKEMWPEEMWQIWDGDGSGVVHIDGAPYEYGFVEPDSEIRWSEIDTPPVWLRPAGKDAPIVTSGIKRNDPLYLGGTKRFKDMVETVRLIHNVLNAKGAGVLAKLGML